MFKEVFFGVWGIWCGFWRSVDFGEGDRYYEGSWYTIKGVKTDRYRVFDMEWFSGRGSFGVCLNRGRVFVLGSILGGSRGEEGKEVSY